MTAKTKGLRRQKTIKYAGIQNNIQTKKGYKRHHLCMKHEILQTIYDLWSDRGSLTSFSMSESVLVQTLNPQMTV
jgi:hypothetical protein